MTRTSTIPNQMYIDGQWTSGTSNQVIQVINPASEIEVDSVPIASIKDLNQALNAADRGWRHWQTVDAWARSSMLRKISKLIYDRVEIMAEVLTEEQGKPLAESRGEVLASADQFDWYADEARRIYGRLIDGHNRHHRLLVMRQPIGPVVSFSPWNFPSLLVSRKIAPALAAGCSIILKPAEETPRSAFMLAEACHDAGLPPGVVNVVTGNPEQISAHLINSPVIRKVSLTGSVPVGRTVLRNASEHIKPVTLELGGHCPVLVFDDVSIDRAAEICAKTKFRNNGQVCISPSRFIVQNCVLDEFVDRFVHVVRSLCLGDGRDPQTDIGPLTSERRRTHIEELVADARDRGAKLVCGGVRPDQLSTGYYFEPTVLLDVSSSMRVLTDEPFGPVAPIMGFSDLEDGLAKANAGPYGLAGYVFTNSTRTAFLASEGLEVGMVGVNNMVIATAEIPFGGIKQSGFGREGGTEWIESYTTTKYVNMLLS